MPAFASERVVLSVFLISGVDLSSNILFVGFNLLVSGVNGRRGRKKEASPSARLVLCILLFPTNTHCDNMPLSFVVRLPAATAATLVPSCYPSPHTPILSCLNASIALITVFGTH